MFQRANAPHYSQPHKAYENKNPQEPPPPAKPVSRQKDYNDNEKRKLKKPILRLCKQTQHTRLPPAKGLRHLLHRRRLAAPLQKTQETPETASPAK